MAKYRKIISNLAKEKEKDLNSTKYYISIYFPIKDVNPESYSTEDILTRIKSKIREKFRSHEILKDETDTVGKLMTQIEKYIKSTENRKSGFAIFIKFDLEKINKTDITFVILNRKPEQSIYLAKIFNLDQLIWLNNISDTTLIMNIDTDKCDVYAYQAKRIEKIFNKENLFVEIKKPQYQERFYVPRAQKKAGYGVGEGKRAKSHRKINKEFLNQILSIITDPEFTEYDFNKVIIFYSSKFTDFINEKVEDIDKAFPQIDFILRNKNYHDENKLRNETAKIVKKLHKDYKESIFKLLQKEGDELFVTGWSDVLDKLKLGQIETLFIKPNLIQIGYLDESQNNEFIYNYPKKNTARVRSIAPWIINKVLDTGGKVRALKGEEFENAPDISAKLRYTI